MIVYHPGDRYHALKLFYCFADFLIHQINGDKIEVAGKRWASIRRLRGFDILLVNSKDIKKETYITLEHDQMRGWSSVTPIEGFELTLCQGGIVQAQLISQNTSEYDKMLELFKAGLEYLQRHDPEHHERVLKVVDIPSLERKNWKKSITAIEKELTEIIDIRIATQDLERMTKQALTNLINKYRDQGYEITGQEN